MPEAPLADGGFRSLDLASGYDSSEDPLARFYVPVLQKAVSYDRAAGYFLSSSFVTAAAGLGAPHCPQRHRATAGRRALDRG